MKTGKHLNVSKELKTWLKLARKNPNIRKIILGRSENAKHIFSPGTIIFKNETKKGLKFKSYTGNGVRDIYIYCDNEFRDKLKIDLEKHKHKKYEEETCSHLNI